MSGVHLEGLPSTWVVLATASGQWATKPSTTSANPKPNCVVEQAHALLVLHLQQHRCWQRFQLGYKAWIAVEHHVQVSSLFCPSCPCCPSPSCPSSLFCPFLFFLLVFLCLVSSILRVFSCLVFRLLLASNLANGLSSSRGFLVLAWEDGFHCVACGAGHCGSCC